MADPRIRVAVLGDSAMWGQGLRHADKFAVLAAHRIAEAQAAVPVIAPFTARSGAKLLAGQKRGEVATLTLPSGAKWSEWQGDRTDFYDLFPALFQSDEQAIAFFNGADEEVARDVYGEVPLVFPTISYQIARESDALGASVDLLIIDGSVNDIGLQEVLDPQSGPSLSNIDRAIERFAYRRAKDVLSAARAKFPNAVIAVTGYYSPFTEETSRNRLEALLKYLSGRAGWLLWFNDFLTSGFSRLVLPLALLSALFGEDVGELADQAVERSRFAHTRGLFWLRKAVAELYESDRGPGIFFVHPGFRPENGLFAAGTAFLHEGYRLPGEGGAEVGDIALNVRRAHIPRGDRLADLRAALLTLSPARRPPQRHELEAMARELDALRTALDGPASLRARLAELIADLRDPLRPVADERRIRLARQAIEAEVGRIEVTTIASFLHPNEAGARRYADRIVARHARNRELRVRRDLTRLVPASHGELSVRRALRRYHLKAEAGLKAALQHAVVDVIGVEADLYSMVHPGLIGGVFLRLGDDRRIPLEHTYGSEMTVIDTFGELHLGDIESLGLEAGGGADRVQLRSFRLLLNGVPVFETTQRVALGSVRFGYPAP